MSTSNPNPGDGTTPPLDRVRHEMERWLEVARTTGERALETLGLGATGKSVIAPIDVVELDQEILVCVDLPGVPAEFVHLSLVGNMLNLKASRIKPDYPESARRLFVERAAVNYERAIPLPIAVDINDVRAETRDGVLTVTLRKTVAPAGRSIPVVRGGSSGPAADSM